MGNLVGCWPGATLLLFVVGCADTPTQTPISSCAVAAGIRPAAAPTDGRCNATPRLIVRSSSFPRSPEAVMVGVSSIVPSPPDLYYSLFAIDGSRAGRYLSAPLLRVALSGGDATVLAADAWYSVRLLLPEHMIVTAADTSLAGLGDAIIDLPLTGQAPTKLFTLPSDDGIDDGFASDGRFLFFGARRGIEAVPLHPDQPTTSALTLVRDAVIDDLAVLGQRLIFSQPQGEVQSVQLPAGADATVTPLAMTGLAPTDFTVCGDYLCWLDEGNNALEQLNPSSGTVTNLITLTGALASADGFRFDGQDFYVLGNDFANTETIARVPRDGGCAVPVVSMPVSETRAFAVDDACLYWANADGIFSIAKSAEGARQ
jgi:hypothetical protein